MADPTTPQPMTDADIMPADANPSLSEPLKDAQADPLAASVPPKQAIKDGAGKIGQQAAERVRAFADDGKARAGGALDQLSQLLNDAAGQVDEKLGAQYGQYARTAAGQVSGLASTVRDKNVDELLDDARVFVRQSPGVAVGVAAALGFAVARLVQSGLDDRSA